MPGAEEGRGEAVPHERGVVGDDDGLGGWHDLEPDAVTRMVSVVRRRGLSFVAEFIRFSL